uniref:B12-binding domain-containing protein n=1 Tax=Parascaris univalens TaxID=6257 RepID=A0A915BN35_PARUN
MLSNVSSGLHRFIAPMMRNTAIMRYIPALSFASNGKHKSSDLLARVQQFAEAEGRQPRILLARMSGIDENEEKNRMVVATGFADLGFDVDVGPRVQTPEEVAREAVDADVHAISARNLCPRHLTLLPALLTELAKLGRPDILVFIIDRIPQEDYDKLYKHGVAGIFPIDGDLGECAVKTLDEIEASLKKTSAR